MEFLYLVGCQKLSADPLGEVLYIYLRHMLMTPSKLVHAFLSKTVLKFIESLYFSKNL